MSVARVTEISAQSNRSLQDAIQQGIKRANQTLRNVTGAWIKEQQISVEDGKVTGYRVNMLVTFILEDGAPLAATKTVAKAAAPAKKAPAKKAAKKSARKRRR
jgi:flavin-binding protein dodecin